MKKITKFRPRIRSKNFSCDPLRHHTTALGFYPFRSLIRFGSLTPTKKVFPKSDSIIEVNTVEAIERSRSKLEMKQAFANAGVPQAMWWDSYEALVHDENIPYPILAKRVFGFKGKGMVKLNSKEELEDFTDNTNLNGYYFEQFHNYAREYRLHVTKYGCFYGLRKMIKEDTPKDQRWFRNDSNCVWILEENPLFDKPINWDQIESDCVSALIEIGLDTGTFDVKVQSSTTPDGKARENPLYILIEVNSAPSMGDITIEKYKGILPKLLVEKYESTRNN